MLTQKYVSTVEAWRLPISRLAAFALIGLLILKPTAQVGSWPGILMLAAGILLAGIGAFGRLWCSLYIGGRKTHELVSAGPYGWCRNPLYLFSLIGALGVGLSTRQPWGVALLTGFFTLYYPCVIRSEERKLKMVHGQSFLAYCQRVPRFFPRTLAVQEPSSYRVNPGLIRKHMTEAIWFVWAISLVLVIEAIQVAV